jgi:hypothetical protein
VLDEREDTSLLNEEGNIHLKYPPAIILFKPNRKMTLTFVGLPLGIIPFMPSYAKFTVTGRSGKPYRIQRSQYAMMAGYTFTDYKSQGQTIENVIIDIGNHQPDHCRPSQFT